MIDRYGVSAVLVGLACSLPRGALSDSLVICPFRRLTGVPCPACGLTRSWQAAGHLDLRASADLHPLGAATFLAAASFALADRDGMPRLAERRGVQLSAAALWLATWVWRIRRGPAAR